jgi:hypothetical protein
MATTTEIANLALGHILAGRIGNLESEKSEEANVCRVYFSIVQEAVLRDFPWHFASRIAALNLVAEAPNEEWLFSYRLPVEAVKFGRILSGKSPEQEAEGDPVPYRIASDASGQLVYTDKEEAQAEYTVRNPNPSSWPPDFTLAFSLRLASYIAPSLTEGDPNRLGLRALQLYEAEIGRARAAAANERNLKPPPLPSGIRAR